MHRREYIFCECHSVRHITRIRLNLTRTVLRINMTQIATFRLAPHVILLGVAQNKNFIQKLLTTTDDKLQSRVDK